MWNPTPWLVGQIDGRAAGTGVTAEVMTKIRDLAAVAFAAVAAEGLSRVDFFYTDEGEIIINEINTMPGFTPKSMYPQMWAASGLAYPDLIDELLQLGLNRKTGLG